MSAALAAPASVIPSAFIIPMAVDSQAAALARLFCSLDPPRSRPGSRQLVVVAAGGRDLLWSPPRIAAHLLTASAGRRVQVLFHGAARGADQAIAAASDQLGWPQIACPALWQQHGRSAGPIRNRQMLERALALLTSLPAGASLQVIAFPGGCGTASLVAQARRLSRRSAQPIELLQISA